MAKPADIIKATAAAALALATGVTVAQTPNPSFALLGMLQELVLDDPADELSAGSATVNGLKVTLPRNLLITMPGQYLTLNDIFRGPRGTPTAPVLSSSGLALRDPTPPPIPFEIQLTGNMVGGEYIAGVAKIVQQDLNAGAGFVRRIDHAAGELLIGARLDPGTDPAIVARDDSRAARVRLNDPTGVFGKVNADKFGPAGVDPIDQRFSLDPENAPVTAMTGFPMCIPRAAPPANDPGCPLSNRPAGPANTRFTCGPVSAEVSSPALAGCRPDQKAPVREGDYVDYAGMLTETTPGSKVFFIAAHALQVQTGIYTSPGADPAYVFIEEALVGMLGEPFGNIDQERTSRFRTVGFTTDPTRPVDVYLLDVDGAADGKERLLTTMQPQRAGQIGRVRITLDAKSNFLPVTRDVRYRIAGHVSTKVGTLDSGQYTAPVGEYIYPEITRFGQRPAFPVPVPFENYCALKNGGGRLETLGRENGPALGALRPFPQSGHLVAQARADGTPACP